MAKRRYDHAEIHLPYYKQGDDFKNCLEQCRDDPRKALKMHAEMLRGSADMLDEVAEIIQQDRPKAVASKLSGKYPVKMDGDTHVIWISGSPKIIKKLVDKSLAYLWEDEEEE